MAHFVELDENNVAIRGIVVHNNELLIDGVESEQKGIDFCVAHYGGTWIQTSYNTRGGVHTEGGTPLRKNYAGIGYTYDRALDAFIPPQPYASWVLDTETGLWNAPTPMPVDDKRYKWDEATTSWIEATETV